jgi:large subunit ribosomal protein L25
VSEVRIAAEPRTEFGKGPSRRIRRANKVPVVLYGHGEQTRHFSLPGHELMLALKHDSNALLTLQTDSGDQLALPKSIVRDPIRNTLEHVDLVAVRKGETVNVEVPITLIGEAAPDTMVEQQTMTLTVSADATALPDHVELDITGQKPGHSLTAAQVTLPAGTTLHQDADHVIVAFLGVPSEEELEAELAEAEAELGSGQAGAEALEAEAAAEAGESDEGEAAESDAEGDADGDAPASEKPAP